MPVSNDEEPPPSATTGSLPSGTQEGRGAGEDPPALCARIVHS
jgi:hypothetical protein